MLAFASIAVIATIAAGFQAYYSVAHDGPSHEAMTTHRNWAVPSGLALLALAAWRWIRRTSAPGALFALASIVVAGLLTVTARRTSRPERDRQTERPQMSSSSGLPATTFPKRRRATDVY